MITRTGRTINWGRFLHRLLPWVALAFTGIAAAIYIQGCAAGESQSIGDIQKSLDESRIQLATLRANSEAALAKAEAEGDAKAKEKAQKSLEVIAKSEEAANAAKAAVGAVNGDPAASEQLTKYTDKLPFPFNLVAGIGVPLAIAGVQEMRVRRAASAAASIAQGVEEARKNSPEMVKAMDDNKAAIEQKFTPLAKKIIAKHKAKKKAA